MDRVNQKGAKISHAFVSMNPKHDISYYHSLKKKKKSMCEEDGGLSHMRCPEDRSA
jgi:hypothetical protein